MKLLRLKITDPKGFRSLQPGFEYCFRSELDLQEEQGFSPFVCAGPNGSGKSNLLEAVASIFYHLECTYLRNLPDIFRFEEIENPYGFRGEVSTPDGFEIEYLIRAPEFPKVNGYNGLAYIKIVKEPSQAPHWSLLNYEDIVGEEKFVFGYNIIRDLLPDYILGYSSGENEILSLPFFKMRFVQFDEYFQALKQQLPYPGRPESRLVYLDSSFSQAILLCNLLFQDPNTLKPFREDVKIVELKEFRIIIRRSIPLKAEQLDAFDNTSLEQRVERANRIRIENPKANQAELKELILQAIAKSNSVLGVEEDNPGAFHLNLVQLLDGGDADNNIIPRLKRCATCWYLDDASDTLYLDYHVNDATRQAFRDNFSNDPLELFQAFQVLLTLNLFFASEYLKKDLYQSGSLYVTETVPIPASDERIMRFKNFLVTKTDVAEPVLLKSFSDGEHQLLHTLGLCLLFKNTQSLFLLDEPETHFNPDWRANFITRLHECFNGNEGHEMLVTTHTPFLISDSRPGKVLVFKKADGVVSVSHPDYNTLGASINKITMATFGKRETIGLRAQQMLADFKTRSKVDNVDKEQLIGEINRQLGDSVEKVLLIKTILDSMEGQG
jgi:restriction system-associated AAA family ATPase